MKTTSTRLPDWDLRLVAFIAQHRRTPFAWGTHDCCQFARRAVQTMRGHDPVKGRRLGLRRYRTAAAALVILGRIGGVAVIPARCGLQEISVKRAGRGDLVLSPADGTRSALGVCVGEKTVFPAEAGLLFVPTLACARAWRVG